MRTQVRHSWETVALPGGETMSATHGIVRCTDGEHKYTVFKYGEDPFGYVTIALWSKWGKLMDLDEKMGSLGNAQMEEEIRHMLEKNGYEVVEFVDMEGKYGVDVYGCPLDDAYENIIRDRRYARSGSKCYERMASDLCGDDDGHGYRTEETWVEDSAAPLMADDGCKSEEDSGDDSAAQTMEDCIADIQARDCCDSRTVADETPDDPVRASGTVTQKTATCKDNGWEVWLWHGSPDLEGPAPDMIVYGGKRLSDYDQALGLWRDCKTSYPGEPKTLVRIADGRLHCVADLQGFTICLGAL